MGPIVLPEIFLGLVAIRPVPTVEGEVTCIPPCIPPRASASVLGTVNAIASAIVVNFIIVSVVVSEETTAPPVLCFLNSFLRAMEALILVAENNGPTMLARIGVMRALNRHVERVFDSSRKDKHWGRRKLARDR
ncbi:MAG: hypothetical protein QOI53_1546 [Verrucomicrobiota bacterium]|jgi:hypothetical protein|nr:hypothetical protein [Verrucomicrobiota bacterium]